MTITTNASGDEITFASSGGGGSQNLFSTIAVSGQSDVVADSTTDTLTLAAGSNVTITTDASTDTITITQLHLVVLVAVLRSLLRILLLGMVQLQTSHYLQA